MMTQSYKTETNNVCVFQMASEEGWTINLGKGLTPPSKKYNAFERPFSVKSSRVKFGKINT